MAKLETVYHSDGFSLRTVNLSLKFHLSYIFSSTFEQYFEDCPNGIAVFQNLGADATLISPCRPEKYISLDTFAHLANFMRYEKDFRFSLRGNSRLYSRIPLTCIGISSGQGRKNYNVNYLRHT